MNANQSRTIAVALAVVGAGIGMLLNGGASSQSTTARNSRTGTPPAAVVNDGRPTLTGLTSAINNQPVDVSAYNGCLQASSNASRVPVSAYLAGYTNTTKLAGSQPVGSPTAALAQSIGSDEGLDVPSVTVDGAPYNCFVATLQLNDQGEREFPSVTAAFVAFGFLPVSATVHLVQTGPGPLRLVIYEPLTAGGSGYVGVATAEMSLSVSNVRVNGVAMEVGPDCHTSAPLYTPDAALDPSDDQLVLVGGNSPGNPLPFLTGLDGGALAGDVTIPPFVGCSGPTGENLDPLVTSSISGPGNYVGIVAGPLCSGAQGCAPGDSNVPVNEPLWTITHGGSYTGTAVAPLVFDETSNAGTGVKITCATSQIAGVIPNAAGSPRGPQASFHWTGISDCTGTDTEFECLEYQTNRRGRQVCVELGLVSSPYGNWSVAPQGEAIPAFYSYQAGTTEGRLWGVTWQLTGTDVPGISGPCSVDVGTPGGGVSLSYGNSSADLSATGTLYVTNSTCPNIATGSGAGMPFDYQLDRPVNIVSP